MFAMRIFGSTFRKQCAAGKSVAGLCAAAALSAMLLSPAAAQQPVTPQDMDKRLQERADLIAKVNPQGADRIVIYDLAWPKDADEFGALGRHAVLLISAVTRHAQELPIKKVSIQVGEGETALRRLWSKRSEVPAGSVRKLFGTYREDALYLLPVGPLLKGSTVFTEFALERTEFRLDTAEPAFVRAAKGKAGEPSAETLRAFLARQYPGFKIELKP